MQIFLPIIRADFTVLESYVYTPQPPLDCPITAFGGLQDSTFGYSALSAWEKQTTASFSLHQIDGDHFFINTNKSTLLNSVIQSLQFHI
jgi:surfactin synthase thioesterase subunit